MRLGGYGVVVQDVSWVQGRDPGELKERQRRILQKWWDWKDMVTRAWGGDLAGWPGHQAGTQQRRQDLQQPQRWRRGARRGRGQPGRLCWPARTPLSPVAVPPRWPVAGSWNMTHTLTNMLYLTHTLNTPVTLYMSHILTHVVHDPPLHTYVTHILKGVKHYLHINTPVIHDLHLNAHVIHDLHVYFNSCSMAVQPFSMTVLQGHTILLKRSSLPVYNSTTEMYNTQTEWLCIRRYRM